MHPSALFVTTVPITLEAFLVPFAEHFRAQGWRVDALANGAASDPRLEGKFDNAYDITWSRNPLDPGNLLGAAGRVRELVAQGEYDIVHVHTPIASFVTRFALRKHRTRPRVVYTAHGFHFYKGGNLVTNALYRFLEQLAAPWTDYLVTINAEDTEAARSLGLPPDRLRAIPGIGVDVDRLDPASVSAETIVAIRAELELEPEDVAFVMIAEMAPVKRHEHVLRALALVPDPRVVLVLVGTGPLESELHRLIDTLGVAARVRWAGYRRDIPAVLAAGDALVLASEREGLPRSVLEAMAMARPVVGTATRGIVDAIGPDEGWVAAKNDVQALANAMESAAADRSERLRRGGAARERAVAEFSLDRIIRAYEELYREALA